MLKTMLIRVPRRHTYKYLGSICLRGTPIRFGLELNRPALSVIALCVTQLSGELLIATFRMQLT